MERGGTLSALVDSELITLIEWGNSDTFKVIASILTKVQNSHLAATVSEPINNDRIMEIAEIRGRYIEDKKILSLPELAKKELESRKK